MAEQDSTIYEQGTLREISGETLRPGGFESTKEAMEYCQFPSTATLLDVGCGTGATVRFLAENYGLSALGIDSSQVLLESARRIAPEAPLLRGKGECLPFADGQFDGVLFECSFSHMDNADAVLAESYRVLKERGWLMIGDVYFRNRPQKLETGLETTTDTTLPSQSCLVGADSEAAFKAMLATHGFQLERWEDKSAWIFQMIVNSIMKYGSADKLWCCVLPNPGSHTITREQIKAWKPGYFFSIARKKAA